MCALPRQLHTERSGCAGGRAQVHGFGAFGEQFRGQVQALARAGLRVRPSAPSRVAARSQRCADCEHTDAVQARPAHRLRRVAVSDPELACRLMLHATLLPRHSPAPVAVRNTREAFGERTCL